MKKVNRETLRRYNELNKQKKAIEEEMEAIKSEIFADGRTEFIFSDFAVKIVHSVRRTVSFKDLEKVNKELAETLCKVSEYDSIKFTGC